METKENVVVACKLHWTGWVLHAIIGALFLINAFRYLFTGYWSTFAFYMILALGFGGYAYLSTLTTTLSLTETSVVGKTGIIKSKKLASPMSKVQDVGVSNGLFGKIFGYSTVTVSTAGSGYTEYVFTHVVNGEQFQSEFLTRSK